MLMQGRTGRVTERQNQAEQKDHTVLCRVPVNSQLLTEMELVTSRLLCTARDELLVCLIILLADMNFRRHAMVLWATRGRSKRASAGP